MKALICGAEIAGLTLAVCFARYEHPVSIPPAAQHQASWNGVAESLSQADIEHGRIA